MNTFKIFQTIVLLSVLSIFLGCSDEITSPITGSKKQVKKEESKVQDNISTSAYHTKITMEPKHSYSFSYENTGFYSFNSISIGNCDEIKNDIAVWGYLDDEVLMLGCNSNDFWVKSITIANLSTDKTEIDLYLTGSKIRITNPKQPLVNAD